jgi:hypothetical protein
MTPDPEVEQRESELNVELNGVKLRLVGRHAFIVSALALAAYVLLYW